MKDSDDEASSCVLIVSHRTRLENGFVLWHNSKTTIKKHAEVINTLCKIFEYAGIIDKYDIGLPGVTDIKTYY